MCLPHPVTSVETTGPHIADKANLVCNREADTCRSIDAYQANFGVTDWGVGRQRFRQIGPPIGMIEGSGANQPRRTRSVFCHQ